MSEISMLRMKSNYKVRVVVSRSKTGRGGMGVAFRLDIIKAFDDSCK